MRKIVQSGKKNDRRGFTLVELLAVVAIIAILAGFGFVGVINYQHSLKLTEMDNIAREIFIAAQNHLTESKSTGEWDKIRKAHSTDEVGYFGEPFDPSQDETFAPNAENTTENHDWRTITYSPKNADLLDKTVSALGVMLPSGATDETVRAEGYYVIEYDALTATVYGVFYTDNANGVTDGDQNSDVYQIDQKNGRTDGTNVRMLYEKNGEKYAIGYYGGAVGNSFEESSDTEDSTESSVSYTVTAPTAELINEERLLLVVKDPDNESSLSKQWTTQKVNYNYSLNITLFDEYGNSETVSSEDGTTISGGTTTVFVIDSIVDDGKNFAEQFPNLVPGSKIYAEVTAEVTWSDGSNSATCKTDSCNSLFGDDSSLDDHIAVIENGRHLQNLSDELSELTDSQNKGYYIETADIAESISWNSGTNAFVDGIKTEDNTYGLSASSNNGTFYSIVNSHLTSIYGKAQDTTTETATTEAGTTETGITLSAFTITQNDSNSEDSENAGLIASTSNSLSIHDLTIDSFQVTSKEGAAAAALVGAFNGEDDEGSQQSLDISNVTISNVTIGNSISNNNTSKESNTAGAAVGIANGGMVSLDNCILDGSSTIYGKFAGGFIGSVKGQSTIFSSCTAGATDEVLTVTGDSSAGGFIGQFRTGNLAISNSNVLGSTVNITALGKESSAGGIIGSAKPSKADAENEETISMLSIASTTVQAESFTISASRHAGGFIGQYNLSNNTMKDDSGKKDTNATLKNDTITVTNDMTVKVAQTDKNNDTYCAGGMIGEVKDTVNMAVAGCSINADNLAVSATGTSDDNAQMASAGGLFGQIYFSGNCSATSSGQLLTVDVQKSNITTSTALSVSTDAGEDTIGAAGGAIGSIIVNSGSNTIPSIKLAESSLTTGGDCTINGASKDDGVAGGLIGYTSTSGEIGFDSNSTAPIQVSSCQITVNNSKAFKVTATGRAGGLIGVVEKYLAFNLDQCTIDADNGTVQADEHNAGGLVGVVKENVKVSSISGCSVSGDSWNITAGENAGGLVGLVNDNADGSSITLSDSTVTGSTVFNVTGTKGDAGGLVGRINNKEKGSINYTLSNCSVITGQSGLVSSTTNGDAGGLVGSITTDKDNQNNDSNTGIYSITGCSVSTLVKASEGNAGGLIGVISGGNASVTVDQCYALGRTSQGAYVTGADNANVISKGDDYSGGGLIGSASVSKTGKTSGKLTVTNSFTTCSVYGEGHACGFIGYAKNIDVTVNNSYCTGLITTTDSQTKAKTGRAEFAWFDNASFSGSNNYYLVKINEDLGRGYVLYSSSSNGFISDSDASQVDGTVKDIKGVTDISASSTQAAATPYDSIGSTYPFKTVAELAGGSSAKAIIAGDWPNVPDSGTGDSLIYIEKVVDSNDTANPRYFVHGINLESVADFVSGEGDEVNVICLSTQDALAEEDQWVVNENGMPELELGNSGKYVVDAGYYVLQKTANVTVDQSGNVLLPDNIAFTNPWGAISYSLTEESSDEEISVVLTSLGISIDSEDDTKDDETSYKLYRLTLNENDENKEIGVAVKQNNTLQSANVGFHLGFGDYFDTDTTDSEQPELQIRSADQFLNFYQMQTNWDFTQFIGSRTVYQTMDIDLQYAEDVSQVSRENYLDSGSYNGTYIGQEWTDSDGTVHDPKVIGLQCGLASSMNGQMENLNFVQANTESLFNTMGDQKPAVVSNITIDDSTFGTESDSENAGAIVKETMKNGDTLEEITINNSTVYGNGIVNTITSNGTTNTLKTIIFNNTAIAKNGIANSLDNPTDITGIEFNGCSIGENGFAKTAGSATTVDGVTFTNTSIGENGFAETASGKQVSNITFNLGGNKIGENGFAKTVNSGTIVDTVTYTNADIGENGFAETLSGQQVSNITFNLGGNKIGENGFAKTVNYGTIVDTVTYTNADISGNGFAETLHGNPISNITYDLDGHSIGGNGFAEKLDNSLNSITNVTFNNITSIGENGFAGTFTSGGSAYDIEFNNIGSIGGSGFADTISNIGITIQKVEFKDINTIAGDGFTSKVTECKSISEVSIENVGTITQNGFATSLSLVNINNVAIQNVAIGNNGFVDTVSGDGNKVQISDISLKHALIGQNGFGEKVQGGTITNVNLVNVGIGENGFLSQNSAASINNCHIYGDPKAYEEYLTESGKHYYSPKVTSEVDGRPQYGYNLVEIGLHSDGTYGSVSSGDFKGIAGFIGTNRNAGQVIGCSVTGKVYSSSVASGFVGVNSDWNSTVDNCYSNVIINTNGNPNKASATGFCYQNEKQAKITNSHSSGKITTTGKGYGFINKHNSDPYSIANCYAAIWSAKADTYYPFTATGSKDQYSNCAYLQIPVEGQLYKNLGSIQNNANITEKTDAELRNITGFGTYQNATDGASSYVYNQYTKATVDSNTYYPYPMPSYQGTVLASYGDWYDTDLDSVSATQ